MTSSKKGNATPERERRPRPGDSSPAFRALRAAFLFGLLAVAGACGKPERGPLPSVVLITIDTIRADHLGCYGYFRDTSPHLDRFSGEAVLFENAVAPMATTLPVHVSLLTSTYPARHRIKNNHQTITPEFPLETLPRLLGKLGYRTAAFVSALPLKTFSGLSTGFDVYREPEGLERRAEETTKEAMAWLSTVEEGPIFLWVHYFDPHYPYAPPPPFDEAFRTDDALLEFLVERDVSNRKMARAPRNNNLYDGEILYLDGWLNELFGALRAHGLWDDAAVVVAGDHGEGLGEHDYRDHGRIYNEQLLVPLIMKFPRGRGPAGVRSPRLASLIDVIPTLVAALDLPVPEDDRENFQGVDLLDDRVQREHVFAERSTPPHRVWEPGEKYALMSREWKYFHLTERPDRLHDLRRDPNERLNLIRREPDVARSMKDELLRVLEESGRAAVPEPGDAPPEAHTGLRALGYVN